jgi:rod shape-determining protein MreC
VAVFAAGSYRPSPGRGASPGFRFTVYAALAILIMFLDQRRGWLEQARYYLSATAYPLQLAVSSPSAAWRWFEDSVETRDALRAENARLRQRERELEMRSLRFEALSRENGELRGLRDALPAVADHWMVAEIVNVELNSLQQRVLVNRGARNGVFKGQAVMDSEGLLGQTMHVGPWSAEVILVTDPEHALPVQIERTGVRTIAVGTGDTQSLALPYLPANADVKSGDLLVTSGLGGVFPQGYPVARVVEVRRDAVQPLAQIRARPLARLDSLREVMLVWFRPDHPAAPGNARGGGTVASDLRRGNPVFQPQPVPERHKEGAASSDSMGARASTARTATPPGAAAPPGSTTRPGSTTPPGSATPVAAPTPGAPPRGAAQAPAGAGTAAAPVAGVGAPTRGTQ